MVKGYQRYDYSNIVSRPVYDWPNGTRVAEYAVLNNDLPARFRKHHETTQGRRLVAASMQPPVSSCAVTTISTARTASTAA